MTVTVTQQGRVVVLMLNRPEARNALAPETRDALESELMAFERNADLAVAIITGAGDQAFCAGADLKVAVAATATGPAAIFDPANRSLVRDLHISKPVIAAINGLALGGGLELALCCDIRIASRNASFGLPEVRIGSMPGSGGTQRLARIVGIGNAMQMSLTGDRIDAEEALRIGLVSHVVEREVLTEAMTIATRIAENAPISVRAIKKAIREGLEMPLPEGLNLERMLFTMVRDTEDRAEGRKAFREKRRPVFKGR
jgi:E-phenylitaconyl-CoA hydratase